MEGSPRAKNKTPATSEVLECAGNSGWALWEVFGTEAVHLTGRLDDEQLRCQTPVSVEACHTP